MTRPLFIAHAPADAPAARVLCEGLERRGLACWLAPRDLGPGGDDSEQIARAIEAASLCLVVLSRACDASERVSRELARAAAARVPIAALRIENVRPRGALAELLTERPCFNAFGAPLLPLLDALARSLQPLAEPPPQSWVRAAPSPARAAAPRLLPPPRARLTGVLGATALLLVLTLWAARVDGSARAGSCGLAAGAEGPFAGAPGAQGPLRGTLDGTARLGTADANRRCGEPERWAYGPAAEPRAE